MRKREKDAMKANNGIPQYILPYIHADYKFNPMQLLSESTVRDIFDMNRLYKAKLQNDSIATHAMCCLHKATRIYFDIVCFSKKDVDEFVYDFDSYDPSNEFHKGSPIGVYTVTVEDDTYTIRGYLYQYNVKDWYMNLFQSNKIIQIQKENHLFYQLIKKAPYKNVTMPSVDSTFVNSIRSDVFFESWRQYLTEMKPDSKFIFAGIGAKQYFTPNGSPLSDNDLFSLSNLTATIVTTYSDFTEYSIHSISDQRADLGIIHICDFDYDHLLELRKYVSENSTLKNKIAVIKEIDMTIRLLTSSINEPFHTFEME